MAEQQEDGYYPRLSKTLLNKSHANMIVSMVGSLESIMGESLDLRTADGKIQKVLVEPDFVFQQGNIVEIVGAVTHDNSIQCFVTREMGADFDLELYNELITKIQPRFSEYFNVVN
mmetsp:Transcript_17195/g.24308  ORF Transcript_17195/g.24308 Transcript_17195/m.24308 type:complete len:116 (-) Transcript_17195:377-724(-)|eukprot:CAMPEP_0184862372 /NCGR_PEP_ID=MMETSP0580-20130426/6851_1 /TAXON_ID=1118495 /ORGANISM="Dactyliosolen fragilissimus" /LENGTH=115 /DNA_ID=CAMNT_0027360217 /DNA_START=114 /DNA_END=461 /DNA_ORIENTATION=-